MQNFPENQQKNVDVLNVSLLSNNNHRFKNFIPFSGDFGEIIL